MKGLQEIIKNIDRIEKDLEKQEVIALKKEAFRIMADSLEHYAPQDEGDLIKSSFINEPTKENGELTIQFGYGKGKAEEYAVALHEHPSRSSPPTWKGKELTFGKPGTGEKYLERPLFKAVDGMTGRLSNDIKIK